MSEAVTETGLEVVQRLTRDIRNAAITLSDDEARFLVDAYYALQRDRIRAGHQERQLSVGGEPHDVMSWLMDQRETLENQVRRALDAYSGASPVGIWARSVTGIGPVIAAGLLANIYMGNWCMVCHGHSPDDCERFQADKKRKLAAHSFTPGFSAPTVGHIWRFAGLDPTSKWEKGTRRPWNGSLKRLCWLIGESFVKVSANESDTYGKVYRARKDQEIANNEAGRYADQAAASLSAKKFGADTEARKHYEAGMLPPARIHLRSERYAVKLFLSHLHWVWYFTVFKRVPPFPYILTQPGHVHFIGPPNAHLIPGLEKALRAMPPPAAGTFSQPIQESAPGNRSEPVEGRAPKPSSEPKSLRAPKQASEPAGQIAPKNASEPVKERAPKRVSEPTKLRAPKHGSKPTVVRAPTRASKKNARKS